MKATVVDNPDRSRYEVFLDGELGGFADYALGDGVIAFTHTEVAVEGRGLGGELVRHALRDARSRGLKVRPDCSFVRDYLAKHPELAEVTDE
ncbi:GNAT family N-acetyltransferase [Saccharothrix coeruleofusca]|uniref:N-acetyltransferase n=1 Tax=Saccharothrix coeruleofusca TaxID=33919 RepID=A0A918ASC3_9PSEU|nr:GNAT family N-acetyltransferase [Saccharothrix coeruleofusca]MBP2337640.1 putative GNAT family acetyltransferase [Saccharothrix coeruleofusca]GGP64504.1 N-acetyltransferase [Saccharothrix coeruleofusca]